MAKREEFLHQDQVWDVAILDRMGAKARIEIFNAWKWLERYPSLSMQFCLKSKSRHPALWWSETMEKIESGIKNSFDPAIQIGCLFIADDPKTPFGKIHKMKVSKYLKTQAHKIPNNLRDGIRNTVSKLEASQFKPREFGYFLKLIESFDDH